MFIRKKETYQELERKIEQMLQIKHQLTISKTKHEELENSLKKNNELERELKKIVDDKINDDKILYEILIKNNIALPKYDLYQLLNESTFSIDVFKDDKEKDIIDEWYQRIGQTVMIEYMNVKITVEELDKLLEFTGKNIDISKKDSIIQHINFIKNYVSINKEAEKMNQLKPEEKNLRST